MLKNVSLKTRRLYLGILPVRSIISGLELLTADIDLEVHGVLKNIDICPFLFMWHLAITFEIYWVFLDFLLTHNDTDVRNII